MKWESKTGCLLTTRLFYDFVYFRFQAPRGLGGWQDPQCLGPGTCLCAVVDTEFAVDIAGVDFYSVKREEKSIGDLSVRSPSRHALKHFDLAFTQRFDQF